MRADMTRHCGAETAAVKERCGIPSAPACRRVVPLKAERGLTRCESVVATTTGFRPRSAPQPATAASRPSDSVTDRCPVPKRTLPPPPGRAGRGRIFVTPGAESSWLTSQGRPAEGNWHEVHRLTGVDMTGALARTHGKTKRPIPRLPQTT